MTLIEPYTISYLEDQIPKINLALKQKDNQTNLRVGYDHAKQKQNNYHEHPNHTLDTTLNYQYHIEQ